MASPTVAANAYANLARILDSGGAGKGSDAGGAGGGPSFGALLKDGPLVCAPLPAPPVSRMRARLA